MDELLTRDFGKKVSKRDAIREESFGLGHLKHASRPEYNALMDPNMRHYFENKSRQRHLIQTGLIDANGRVLDVDHSTAKLRVIEREFREAEKQEILRLKDEEEMRRRVQMKRLEALELARRQERFQRMKEDREMAKTIVSVLRNATAGPSSPSSSSRSASRGSLGSAGASTLSLDHSSSRKGGRRSKSVTPASSLQGPSSAFFMTEGGEDGYER